MTMKTEAEIRQKMLETKGATSFLGDDFCKGAVKSLEWVLGELDE